MTYIPALAFDRLTPLFDAFVELFGFGRRERDLVVDLLDLRPGERLLDLGCGTGTQVAAARGRHAAMPIVGTDVDPAALVLARRKLVRHGAGARPVWLVQSSADALPFPNGSFDVVVSTLVFHHLPTSVKRGALREVRRVLAPGGRFLLVDLGAADRLWLRAAYLLVRAAGLAEAQTAADNVAGRIPALLAEAGFVASEVAPRRRGVRFLRVTRRPT